MVVIKGLDEKVYRSTCDTFGPLWFSEVSPARNGVDITLASNVSLEFCYGVLNLHQKLTDISFKSIEFEEVTIA